MESKKTQIERLVDGAVKNFEKTKPMTGEELNRYWDKKEKPEYEINNWYLDDWYEDYYVLKGYITGHFNVEQDTCAHTSKLIKIDFSTMIAETENSVYKLGKFYPRGELVNNLLSNKDEIKQFFKDNFPTKGD